MGVLGRLNTHSTQKARRENMIHPCVTPIAKPFVYDERGVRKEQPTDQEVAVRVVESSVVHGLVGGIDEDGHSVLDTDIAGTGNGVETFDKVSGLGGDVKGRPTELVGGDIDIGLIGVVANKVGLSVEGLERSVADRGADTVDPAITKKGERRLMEVSMKSSFIASISSL